MAQNFDKTSGFLMSQRERAQVNGCLDTGTHESNPFRKRFVQQQMVLAKNITNYQPIIKLSGHIGKRLNKFRIRYKNPPE